MPHLRRPLFPSLLLLPAVLAWGMLCPAPSAAEPENAFYLEKFNCFSLFEGTDEALPERLVLDQTTTGAYGQQHHFTGVSETEGTGLALPLATLDLTGQGLIGGEPGDSRVRCNGSSQIIYEVEIRHDAGTLGRYVPIRIASRGGVSASASSWGGKGSISLQLRVTPGDGSPVTSEFAQACEGTVLSGCNTIPSSDVLDVAVIQEMWVPAGVAGSVGAEISIATGGYVDTVVQMYAPWQGGEDRAGNATISGWIDPQVWIDPGFEHAAEYSLHFSAGVPVAPDADGDVVPDAYDNCSEVGNPGQADVDAPGDDDSSLPGTQHYGDACDVDLDNDGLVAASDFFGVMRPCFGAEVASQPACAVADLDEDGVVGPSDFFGGLRPALGGKPGPGVTEP